MELVEGLATGASLRDRWQPDLESRRDSLQCPGNRFKALAGDRKGQHSIRVNQQYRVTFRWESNDAYDVRCEDYH